jgi:myo-inositol-1(or 4)-monophosphatase
MTLVVSEPALAERLELAREVARRAGALQRERYETDLTIDSKSASIDLVTEVDRACEALIVAAIRDAFPRDAILAEEGGIGAAPGAEFCWIIDPLDGTTNFAHGFPRFCVSIGIERRDLRVVAVVYDPLLDECFEAVRGAGAWLGARRLSVSRETELGRGLFATGFPYDVHASDDDNLEAFARVVKSARGIRRDGSAALDLCYVAAGRIDGYWERKLHAWDVAAGILLVEEAGGRVSDEQGGPVDRSGRELVATNGPLHASLLEKVRKRSAG